VWTIHLNHLSHRSLLPHFQNRELEIHEMFSSPTEALGHHGFVTYSTKDTQEAQERMLTWRL